MATDLFLNQSQLSRFDIDTASTTSLLANTRRGSGVATSTTNTVTGPTSGVQCRVSGAGNVLEWYSPPLDAITISGDITFNLWAEESAMQANAGMQVIVELCDANYAVKSTIINSEHGTELGTSLAARNWTASPTSTAVKRGDRLRIRVFINDAGGDMASGHTASMTYAGKTASASGDSWIRFTETFVVVPQIVTMVGGESPRETSPLITRDSDRSYTPGLKALWIKITPVNQTNLVDAEWGSQRGVRFDGANNNPQTPNSVYARMRFKHVAYGTTMAPFYHNIVEVLLSRIALRGTETGYQLTYGETNLVGSEWQPTPNQWYDLVIIGEDLDDAGAAKISLVIDGTPVASTTTATLATTGPGIFRFGATHEPAEIIIDDAVLALYALPEQGVVFWLPPVDEAENSNFTGAYTDVDDPDTDGDTTYVASSTVGAFYTAQLRSAVDAGLEDPIYGVVPELALRQLANHTGRLRTKANTTYLHTQSSANLISGYPKRQRAYLQDPSTQDQWSASSLDLAVGYIIDTASGEVRVTHAGASVYAAAAPESATGSSLAGLISGASSPGSAAKEGSALGGVAFEPTSVGQLPSDFEGTSKLVSLPTAPGIASKVGADLAGLAALPTAVRGSPSRAGSGLAGFAFGPTAVGAGEIVAARYALAALGIAPTARGISALVGTPATGFSKPGYHGERIIHVDNQLTSVVPTGPLSAEGARYRGRGHAIYVDERSPTLHDSELRGPFFQRSHYKGRSKAVHVFGPRDDPPTPDPVPSCDCCNELGQAGSLFIIDDFNDRNTTGWDTASCGVEYNESSHASILAIVNAGVGWAQFNDGDILVTHIEELAIPGDANSVWLDSCIYSFRFRFTRAYGAFDTTRVDWSIGTGAYTTDLQMDVSTEPPSWAGFVDHDNGQFEKTDWVTGAWHTVELLVAKNGSNARKAVRVWRDGEVKPGWSLEADDGTWFDPMGDFTLTTYFAVTSENDEDEVILWQFDDFKVAPADPNTLEELGCGGESTCTWEDFEDDSVGDWGEPSTPGTPPSWSHNTDDPAGLSSVVEVLTGEGRLSAADAKFTTAACDVLEGFEPLGVPYEVAYSVRFVGSFTDATLLIDHSGPYVEIRPTDDEYDFSGIIVPVSGIDWNQAFGVRFRYEETPGAGPFGGTLQRTFVRLWQGTEPSSWDEQADGDGNLTDTFIQLTAGSVAAEVRFQSITISQGDPPLDLCGESTLENETEQVEVQDTINNPSDIWAVSWNFITEEYEWTHGTAYTDVPHDEHVNGFNGLPNPPGGIRRRTFLTYAQPEELDPDVIEVLSVRVKGSSMLSGDVGDEESSYQLEQGNWEPNQPSGPDYVGTVLVSHSSNDNDPNTTFGPPDTYPFYDDVAAMLPGPDEKLQLTFNITSAQFPELTQQIQAQFNQETEVEDPSHNEPHGIFWLVNRLTGRKRIDTAPPPGTCAACGGFLPFTPHYLPIFRRQIGDPTTTLDAFICTLEAGAMALDWQTRGATQVWGGELIPWCGKSEADIGGASGSPGTSLDNVRQAWRHWNQVLGVRSGQTWAQVLSALGEGRAVILQGDYGELPTYVKCQANFEDNHAIILLPSQVSGRIIVGDPLCTTWHGWDVADLQTYAEEFGEQVFGVTSPQKILFAVSSPWLVT